jgi:hypothetical protein
MLAALHTSAWAAEGFDPELEEDEAAPVPVATQPAPAPSTPRVPASPAPAKRIPAAPKPVPEPNSAPNNEPQNEPPEEEIFDTDDEKDILPTDLDEPAPVAPAPAPPPAAPSAPYQEKGPSDITAYKQSNRAPRFLRINGKGQGVRASEDFKGAGNIDFRSKGGEVYVVESVRHGTHSASVQINVDGEKRWVEVPYARKDDFQFCESEACFMALADSLDFFLRGSGVSAGQARDCGVSAGPEGLVLPLAAPPPPKPKPLPQTPRPKPVVKVAASGKFRPMLTPLWEKARGAQGAKWTQHISDAIDKFGQGMMGKKHLSDARAICPRFGALEPGEKKEFFLHFFNGIARYESNFKTAVPVFDEQRYKNRTPPYNLFRGPIKPRVYSMGLFALSYSAAPGYRPQCRINYDKDRRKDISDPSLTIYDPQIQAECAVTIMNKWVTRDGAIGIGGNGSRGGARYWGTLRGHNPAARQIASQLKRFTPCWEKGESGRGARR